MAQAKAGKLNVVQRLRKYLKEVWAELHRVVWPQPPEIVNSSMVVIVTLVIMTVFVLVIDLASSFTFIDVLAKIGR